MTASVTPDGYLITVSMIDLLFRNSDRGKAICDLRFECGSERTWQFEIFRVCWPQPF